MTTDNSKPSLNDLYEDFGQLHESYQSLWMFAGDLTDIDAGKCAVIVKMLNYRFESLLLQFDQALHSPESELS